jgi:hypothetical protein
VYYEIKTIIMTLKIHEHQNMNGAHHKALQAVFGWPGLDELHASEAINLQMKCIMKIKACHLD